MNLRFLLTPLCFLFFCPSFAQEEKRMEWTLQQAIEYALQHNISIKQNELNARLAQLQLQQSQLSQLPNITTSAAYGRSFGRSVDPTTNQFVNSNYDFLSLSGSADALVFGWFQKRNTIGANKYALNAAKADLEQLQNDVSLNVATGYLRAILAREQVRISEKQVSLSAAQLHQTEKFVEAGRLPELSAKQLEAQLANDSATLINNIAAYNNAIIDIKALLNLDFATPFDIIEPEVKVEEQFSLNEMSPEYVFTEALKSFNTIKSSEFNLLASQKRVKAARGALYPQLGINAQSGTNYASTFKEVTGFNITGAQPTGAYAVDSVSQRLIPVYQPIFQYQTQRIPVDRQLNNNFRQTLSLALNIPIFNAWQAQFNLRQAKINREASDYNMQQAELKLKQDVYKAYNDAYNAIQKYYAAVRAENASQDAYNFAKKRYELGLTNTVEYLTTQNTQFVSESNLQSAKYDLIFKLKVIDYYLGKQLKL
ncbi:MAG TPA: TolC family protein [Flavipsychrobacter sp.]|nr:TolC family protein [Flavipsychrobacter sp.]